MYLFALIYPHFIFINSIICFCKLHFFLFFFILFPLSAVNNTKIRHSFQGYCKASS